MVVSIRCLNTLGKFLSYCFGSFFQGMLLGFFNEEYILNWYLEIFFVPGIIFSNFFSKNIYFSIVYEEIMNIGKTIMSFCSEPIYFRVQLIN